MSDGPVDLPKNSASAKVFGTVELLESILVNLPLSNLLQSQVVSIHWRDTIVGSTKIQQALFFQPVRKPNPRDKNGSTIDWSDWDWYDNWEQPGGVAFLNPLIHRSQRSRDTGEEEKCLRAWLFLPEERRSPLQKFYRPDASWRKMQLAQPVFHRVEIPFCKDSIDISNADGVTVGELMDTVREHISGCFVQEYVSADFGCRLTDWYWGKIPRAVIGLRLGKGLYREGHYRT